MKCKNCRDWSILIIRVFIGLLFVMAAYGKFTGMEGTIGYIASTWLPAPAFMAWAAAIVEMAGGLMIIFGFHSSVAAVVLGVFLLVVNFTFHLDLGNQMQMMNFLKNLAVIGGLLGLYVSGSGKFALVKCKCCHGLECKCDR